jgi:hypothetical protein
VGHKEPSIAAIPTGAPTNIPAITTAIRRWDMESSPQVKSVNSFISRITRACACDLNERLGAVRIDYPSGRCGRDGMSEFHAMRECHVRSNNCRQTGHSMRNESVAG